ncbi:expressed unknown protein [Seminavis robusta]|uniref:Uncharacterized protein n=1 Tax=Seminavis robusta TaxID=568900 RepID=A0A9N8DHG3_9STRA|nr:expressed unknown protein [Seminavis robusta]|eukprot:Sro129_g061670.1 n/a (565) ;mRNA; r:87708-89402
MTTPADTTSASIHGNDALLLSNDKTHHYHGGKMQHRLAPRRPSNNTRGYNNMQKHRQGNIKKKSHLSYAGSYRGGLWNQVYGHSAAPPVAGYYNPTSTRGQQPFSFPQAGLPDGGIYYPSSTTTTMAYRYHKGTTYYNLRRDNNGKSSNKSPPAAAVVVGPNNKSSLSVDAQPFVPGKFVATTTGTDAVGGVPHGGAKNIKILLPTLNDDDDGHHHKTNKKKNQEDSTNSTTPTKSNKPVLVLDAATPTTAKSQNTKIENKNDGAAKDKKKSVVVKMGPPPGFASPSSNKAAPVAVVSPSPGLVRRRDDASVDSRGVMVVGAVSPSPLKVASPRSSSTTNTMNNKAAPAIVSPLPTPARVLPPPPGLSKTEEKVSSTAFLPKELWAETVDDLSPKEKEAMIAPIPAKTHSPSPVTVADYPALVVVDSKQTSVQSPWNTNTNKTKKNAWNRGSAAVLAAVSPQHQRNSSTPPVQTAWANKAVVVPEEAPTPTTSNSSSSKTVVGMEEHHQPAKEELADDSATDYDDDDDDDEEEEEDSPFTRGLSPKDLLLQAHGVHFVKTPRQW